MKKKILFIIAIIVLITIPTVIFFTLKINGKSMSNGTYYAVNCEEYPDAYVVVKGETIQFYNIDLNAIYREDQLNSVYMKQNNENLSFNTGLTDEELLELSDLNNMFVNNPYKYDSEDRWKEGTYIYYYRCLSYGNWFGLHLLYDSWNKTITINNYQLKITFEKR